MSDMTEDEPTAVEPTLEETPSGTEADPALDTQPALDAVESRVEELSLVLSHFLPDGTDIEAWLDTYVTYRRDGTPVYTCLLYTSPSPRDS